MEPLDFVAIGDITTDAFIRLKDAEEMMNHGVRELCVRFGDKVPYEFVEVVRAVGNSPNAAVSAARLGLKSAVVCNIGNDQNGVECVESLGKDKVDTRFVKVHQGKLTNYHYVLWYADERTILIKHQEYDYQLPDLGEPKWIYLSSMGENTLAYQHAIAAYVKAHPNVKMAFQPGTFQIKENAQLKDIYEASEIFFCNVEEAQRILQTEDRDLKKLLEGIRAFGPKTVVITDGPKGAYALDGSAHSTGSGQEAWYMPIYPDPKPPYERTGAGDAFASTFTAALAMGKSVADALRLAPVNSMSVVQDIGAQRGLLTMEGIEGWLAKAPADYQPKKL